MLKRGQSLPRSVGDAPDDERRVLVTRRVDCDSHALALRAGQLGAGRIQDGRRGTTLQQEVGYFNEACKIKWKSNNQEMSEEKLNSLDITNSEIKKQGLQHIKIYSTHIY